MTRSKHCIAALLLLCNWHLAGATAPVRILCVGDSMTQGGVAGRAEHTYRLPLQRLLAGAGVRYDFVGTRAQGLHPEAKWPPGFDPDHEGHYGATAGEVRDRLLESMPRLPRPDVALVLVGWNDLEGWHPLGYFDALYTMVRALKRRSPNVTVLVGQVPRMGWRSRYLRFLAARAARLLDSRESPVVLVETFPAWDAHADTFDGVHPNPRGAEKIAWAWWRGLSDARR